MAYMALYIAMAPGVAHTNVHYPYVPWHIQTSLVLYHPMYKATCVGNMHGQHAWATCLATCLARYVAMHVVLYVVTASRVVRITLGHLCLSVLLCAAF